jgi:hypothetical protein
MTLTHGALEVNGDQRAVTAGANKRLPDALEPRPLLEVRSEDLIVTSAGPSSLRCHVSR